MLGELGRDLERQQSTAVRRMDTGAGQPRFESKLCHLLYEVREVTVPQFLHQISGDVTFAYFSGLL